ncbi:MAG: tripartite tricarboxylate transporter substrate binding protein [Betaproteobacteria bacterium]|nr:tripartite tricarboxylate transporter substrate binding protein [Betaproteobacteria bacterium]
MKRTIRHGTFFRIGALAVLLASPAALAQGYPAKPVRMIITFPPGGPSEIVTRLVSERLHAELKQPFVVENRAGAGGNVGADAVAKALPDGHVFGITTDTLFTVNPLVYAKMPFDPWNDIVPVALLGSFSQMMVCNPSVAAKTLAELLALARRERLTYASGGAGVPGHLAAELLLAMTQVEMVHVPYKGPAAATSDVMGGQVHCGFLATPTVLPQVKAGKLNALAVSTAQRSPLAPQIPTAAEAGVAGFDAPFYLVLFAPKDTPAEVIRVINREVAKALSAREVRERAAALDVVTLGGSPEAAAKTLRTGAEKWAPVIRRIGLKLN